jgi:hypothetical protein
MNITDVTAFNKSQLFDILEKASASLEVTYSGEGDEGHGFEVSLNNSATGDVLIGFGNPIVRAKRIKREFQSNTGKWLAEVEEIETDFDSAVESLCEDLISQAGHDGYENDDGGGGQIKFNLKTREIELQHYDNVMHQEYSSCNF